MCQIVDDINGIDCLSDIDFKGQAKDYVDFLVSKGFESELFFYILKGIILFEFDWDTLDIFIVDNIFPICDELNFRFSNIDFSKFLAERGYR